MRVLVACERSGRVRDALLARGHDAISCDMAPSDAPGPHIQGRVEEVLGDGWDMVIGFPPCTYLSNIQTACVEGTCVHEAHHEEHYHRWRVGELIAAAQLFHAILVSAPRVAVENPMPCPRARVLLGQHQGYTEPFQFGHPWKKRTFWWLRGLAPLQPTAKVRPTHRWVKANSMTKAKDGLPALHRDPVMRSLTPLGLAEAIADQWGDSAPQTLW